MIKEDFEYPLREELSSPAEDLVNPAPETEFRAPDPALEDSPPPGTDHENPAEEQEFTPPGRMRREPPGDPGRSRRLRRVLYASAALLLSLVFFRAPRDPAVPVLAPAETPAPSAVVYSSASDIVIVLPTPEPSLEPTPEPSPVPKELRFEPIFFRCSAIHYGWLEMENQEDVRAVRLEIWESGLNILEWEHDLSAEEIASGYLRFPIVDGNELYFQHLALYEQGDGEQRLELRVTLTVDGPDGPEQRELTVEPSDEQGWGLNYWPRNFEPRWPDQEYYRDSFAVRSYESYNGQPRMRMGSYEDALATGEICVELFIEGKQVPAEDGYVVTRSEPVYRYGADDELIETEERVYYTTVVIPRPADAPESGTATFKIYQKLNGYDKLWIMSASNDYNAAE